MSEFGKCRGGGRRVAPRTAAPVAAVLTTLSETLTAIVIDISRTGVRLRGDVMPSEGQELMMAVEDVRAFGCVAWRHDGECGLALEEPLPLDDVENIRRKALANRFYTPELREAFEDWTVGKAR